MPGLRKPNHRLGGLEVRVCGALITEETICTLPPKHRPSPHATMAITEDGATVAIIRNHGETRTEMWQLAVPPE